MHPIELEATDSLLCQAEVISLPTEMESFPYPTQSPDRRFGPSGQIKPFLPAPRATPMGAQKKIILEERPFQPKISRTEKVYLHL